MKSVTSVTGFGSNCGLRSHNLTPAPKSIQRGTAIRTRMVPNRLPETAGRAREESGVEFMSLHRTPHRRVGYAWQFGESKQGVRTKWLRGPFRAAPPGSPKERLL